MPGLTSIMRISHRMGSDTGVGDMVLSVLLISIWFYPVELPKTHYTVRGTKHNVEHPKTHFDFSHAFRMCGCFATSDHILGNVDTLVKFTSASYVLKDSRRGSYVEHTRSPGGARARRCRRRGARARRHAAARRYPLVKKPTPFF